MLDVINNALRSNDYYICLYKNSVYVYNYREILNFSYDVILIKMKDFVLKIKGSDLHIKRMEHHELLVNGSIFGVFYE